MTSSLDRFIAGAHALGVVVEPAEFPDGTRTAADAAAASGCDVAAIVKSLVFIADEEPILVLVSGSNRVDEELLAASLGIQSLRKATAEEARAATGYAIGGTPPFLHTGTGLRATYCDRDLLAQRTVWAAAGGPTSVFPIDPQTLVRIAAAHITDVRRSGDA